MEATPSAPPVISSSLDAEARLRHAKLISNIGFVAGGLFLFFSVWYIVAKGTPADPFHVFGLAGRETAETSSDGSTELDPINATAIPPIFLDAPPPPPTPVPLQPTETPPQTPEQAQEEALKKALEDANQEFRGWKFAEAEKSYLAIVKALPADRAEKLQEKLTDTFLKRGVLFYRDKKYSMALDVLRMSLHFDPSNVEAHKYLAKCYRLLGQADKAKYHEKMAKNPPKKAGP